MAHFKVYSVCTLCLALFAGCVLRTPLEKKEYYTRNYGVLMPPAEDSTPVVALVPGTAPEVPAEPDVTLAVPDATPMVEANILPLASPFPESTADATEVAESAPDSGLRRPRLYQGSFEEKLWSLVLESFQARDRDKFFPYAEHFLISFPQSLYVPNVNRFIHEFYTSTPFDYKLLQGSWLYYAEIQQPVSVWKDYLKKAKTFGVEAILFKPFQQDHTKDRTVDPYTKGESQLGALFKNQAVPMVSDRLALLVEEAHNQGLRFTAEVPIRNHPWLLYQRSELMDQSYDPNSGGFFYNLKLNLLHPQTAAYFHELLLGLARQPVDSVLLDLDFTLNPLEGFSSFDAIMYQQKTGKKIRFQDFPVSFLKAGDWSLKAWEAMPLSQSYRDFNIWRRNQIHLFLLDLVRYIRSTMPVLKIGIRFPQELMVENELNYYRYGVSLEQVVSLPVDYFLFSPSFVGKQLNQETASQEDGGPLKNGPLKNGQASAQEAAAKKAQADQERLFLSDQKMLRWVLKNIKKNQYVLLSIDQKKVSNNLSRLEDDLKYFTQLKANQKNVSSFVLGPLEANSEFFHQLLNF